MSLWVFGYGSLMWRPGFPFEQVSRARLNGFRRCFCIYSVHHRGTEARPGLVLGLDRGGQCEGVAYRVGTQDVEETLSYLRAREQVNGVYREARVTVEISSRPLEGIECPKKNDLPVHSHGALEKKRVTALTYLVERNHPSFAAQLPLVTQARLISGARGLSGNNMEYLANTLFHLRLLGIRERELERLAVIVGHGVSGGGGSSLVECPRLHGVTRAAAKRPVHLKQLKPNERRRFVYRKFLGKGFVPRE